MVDKVQDLLGREELALKVANVVTSGADVFPFLIDGNWGEGKTVFCQYLGEAIVGIKGSGVAYIDAFKDDYLDDARMMILAAILDSLSKKEVKRRNEMIAKVAKGGLFISKAIGKATLAHLAKSSFEDLEDGFQDAVENVADKAMDKGSEYFLKNYIRENEQVSALQDSIQGLVAENGGDIYIIIDELDRCRPDFSLSILEVIKHVYDVPGLHFLLVANLEQLNATVDHRYGRGASNRGYLNKFFKYTIRLPRVSNQIPANMQIFSSCLSEKNLNFLAASRTKGTIWSLIDHLMQYNKLSLRQAEYYARHLDVLFSQGGFREYNPYFGINMVLCFAVFIYCFDEKLKESIDSGEKLNVARCLEIIGINKVHPIGTANMEVDASVNGLAAYILYPSELEEAKKFVVFDGDDLAEIEWENFRSQVVYGMRGHHRMDPTAMIPRVFSALQFQS